jgi:hypothetical protein
MVPAAPASTSIATTDLWQWNSSKSQMSKLEQGAQQVWSLVFGKERLRDLVRQKLRAPVLSSPDHPPVLGEFPGGAVCRAIGVEFLIRNGTVGPQGPLPSFRQERSLQYLVTEVCGVLIKDLPLRKRLV